MDKFVRAKRNIFKTYRTHIFIFVAVALLSLGVYSAIKRQAVPPRISNDLTQFDQSTAQQTVLPVSYWEDKFKKEIMPTNSYIRTKCNDYINNITISNNMYHFGSNCVDGFVAMYEATGKTIYLDLALDHVNRLISTAKTASNGYRYWDGYAGYPLDQSHTWRHIAKMLYVMKNSPNLLQNTSYKSQYDKILEFTEVHIFQKWWKSSEDRIANGGGDPKRIGDPTLSYVFRSRTHMASHFAMLGMILENIGAKQDWKDEYKLVYTKVNTDMQPYYPSSLRQQLERYPGDPSILIFHDEWGKDYDDLSERPKPTPSSYGTDSGQYHPVSDTHHAQDTIGYILEAYDMGNYWTKSDIDGFINLTLKLTWNKSLTDPKYAGFLDGTEPNRPGSNCIEDGMIKLGRHSAQLQKVIEADTPAGCYPAAFYGSAALNAKKLSGNQTPPQTQPPSTASPITPPPVVTPKPVVSPSPTASPKPIVSQSPSASASITSCASSQKTYTLATGVKWYASKNGISSRKGAVLSSLSGPTYLARWNGTTYQYSSQLPYSPNTYTYPDDVDFMIYNNTKENSFSVTSSNLKSYNIPAGVKWYASKNGYSAYNGLNLQIQSGTNPGYLAPWNGTTYQFKLQLPYSTQWYKYESSNDFMVYNNSNATVLNVCKNL